MTITQKDLDDVTAFDVEELISLGIPEGVRIEFKRDIYGNADSDRKEFLKDVSSFANMFGGHLIIGIDESEGVPTKLCPLIERDADVECQRLESLIRDGLEPRVAGIRMKAVPVAPGGFIVIIRIPRSWNAPHRVALKGTNRFYGRTSAGAYELDVTELRAKFLGSSSAIDRALSFRSQRLAYLAANEGIFPLAKQDGLLAIHISPLAGIDGVSLDLERAEEVGSLLSPLGTNSGSPQYNFEGFANVRHGEHIFGYTQLFRDGAIEATKVRIVVERDGKWRIPAKSFGEPIILGVTNYLEALQRLDVPPPLLVMISLSGVRGSFLATGQGDWMNDRLVTIKRDVLELTPILIESFGSAESYQVALRPAFDALWNASGLPKSTYFDDEGHWAPHD